MTESNTSPRFAVLDVVEIVGAPEFTGTGLPVMDFPRSEEHEVPGRYDEGRLSPTGEHADLRRYGPIPRDVVLIGSECEVVEARGRRGYVHSAYDERPDEKPVGVWVYDLDELCIFDVEHYL